MLSGASPGQMPQEESLYQGQCAWREKAWVSSFPKRRNVASGSAWHSVGTQVSFLCGPRMLSSMQGPHTFSQAGL